MTQNDGLLVQAERADATNFSMIPSPLVVPQGIAAGVQGPSDVANVTSRTVVPEDLVRDMVSPSRVYSTLGDDTSARSAADTNTLGLQASSPPALPTQPHFNMVGVFTPGAQQLDTVGRDICQRQQLIPCEYVQAPITGGFVLGANQIADPITLAGSGAIVGDGWTGTLRWQREREGTWSQVQAVATDGVRNPCVYSFIRCKLIEDPLRRMFSIWPSLLQIWFPETVRVISSLDIQTWLLKTKAPVARIKRRSEDGHQFDDLVKLVRSSGSVSCRSRSSICPPSYTLTVRTGGLGEGTTAISPHAAQRGPIVHIFPFRHRDPTRAPAAAASPKEAPCALELPGALPTRLSAQSCGHPCAQTTTIPQDGTECANSAAD